jgi:hypothetical protein
VRQMSNPFRPALSVVFGRPNLWQSARILAACGYANGVFAHVREVASRTEQYWCPIKHARRVLGVRARYGSFVDYGDGDAYRQRPGESSGGGAIRGTDLTLASAETQSR